MFESTENSQQISCALYTQYHLHSSLILRDLGAPHQLHHLADFMLVPMARLPITNEPQGVKLCQTAGSGSPRPAGGDFSYAVSGEFGSSFFPNFHERKKANNQTAQCRFFFCFPSHLPTANFKLQTIWSS